MSTFQRVGLTLLLLVLLPLSSIATDHYHLTFKQAEKAYDAYEFAQAETFYRQSIDKYQGMGNLTAYIENQIAKCLRYQNKTEEAVAAYKKVREQYPDAPVAGQVQENIARTYYEAGDYEKAGPEFEKLGEELEVREKLLEKQSVSVEVQAATIARNKVDCDKEQMQEKKSVAFGYAELCYSKSGKLFKARSVNKKAKGKK